jgi:hypothetical protein
MPVEVKLAMKNLFLHRFVNLQFATPTNAQTWLSEKAAVEEALAPTLSYNDLEHDMDNVSPSGMYERMPLRF